jgi:hypothetical protein
MIAVMTLAASVSTMLPGPWHDLAHIGQYRGLDLFHEQVLWRLPLSAFLSQSWLQCAFSLLMIVTVFMAAERRIGSVAVLVVVGASHLVSTVAVDSALWFIKPGILAWFDYGPSCLMMGALTALLLRTRSRLLAAGMAGMFAVDIFINSPMSIAEHIVAVIAGAIAYSTVRDGSRGVSAPGRPADQAGAFGDPGARVGADLGVDERFELG